MPAFKLMLGIFITMLALAAVILDYWRFEQSQGRGARATTMMEQVKTTLEIVFIAGGILVGAVLFLYVDQPAMDPQVQITSELESVYQPSTGTCVTEFVVTIKNPTRTRLTIDSTAAYLALMPAPAASDTVQAFTDFAAGSPAHPYYWPFHNGLAYEYLPGAEYTDAFVWTHRPKPDSVVLARIELFTGADSTFDQHYRWGEPCDPATDRDSTKAAVSPEKGTAARRRTRRSTAR